MRFMMMHKADREETLGRGHAGYLEIRQVLELSGFVSLERKNT